MVAHLNQVKKLKASANASLGFLSESGSVGNTMMGKISN